MWSGKEELDLSDSDTFSNFKAALPAEIFSTQVLNKLGQTYSKATSEGLSAQSQSDGIVFPSVLLAMLV